MKTMFKTGTLVFLCLLVGLLACGNNDGDGGCTHDIYIVSVTGPATLAPSAVGTYKILNDPGYIEGYRWSVQGSGLLKTACDQPSVQVRASGAVGAKFTVCCDVKIGGTWFVAKPLEVTVVELPRFRVVLNTPTSLTPTTLTGSSTLQLIDSDASARSWSVYFVGDTSGLPAQVPVTVTTTDGSFALESIWLEVANQTKLLYFPRAGGGSVGLGGTVLDPGFRPDFNFAGPGDTATVTLSAPGVQTMVITVRGYPE